MVNQGIETYFEGLSGTPAEAGVRGFFDTTNMETWLSQWNPCRSRGASPPLECLDIAWGIGTFIHPPADLIVFCDFKEHLRDCSSNYYCLSSGSVFIHPSIRFLYPRFQSEVQHPALVPVRA